MAIQLRRNMKSWMVTHLFLIVWNTSRSRGYRPNFEYAANKSPDRRHCDSQIYCDGILLHDIQMSQVFDDETVFVRKGLRYSEKDILRSYAVLKGKTGGTPSVQQLRTFVQENFIDDSLTLTKFLDFTEIPSILDATDVKEYANWLSDLNVLWNDLGGQVPEDVKMHPDQHSYLYVPNKFVRAGGRFEETYYWDSYWIIKGLLYCDMKDSARGIIEDIISLVNIYDHMPNGNRIYYMKRSQPPLLISMAHVYHELTNNFTFIKENIGAFNTEFHWWIKYRRVNVSINGKNYHMYSYNSTGFSPRPESYKKDYELIVNVVNEEEIIKVLSGIKSAAESGWDFSSRHVRGSNNSNIGTLSQMEPQSMIYVDLNSIMHFNARKLKEWYTQLENQKTAEYFEKIENELLYAIENILWNDKVGIWQDYDLKTKNHRNYFYVSNFTPLWSKSFENKTRVEKAISYLVSEGVLTPQHDPVYYCIPTSMYNSTQQWDFPNCWVPLQYFVVHGLRQCNDVYPKAETIALKFSQRWIDTTYAGYYNNKVMYEKYDATKLGCTGKGGEYKPQTGFGWTNGFTMDIFKYWGKQIKLTNPNPVIHC